MILLNHLIYLLFIHFLSLLKVHLFYEHQFPLCHLHPNHKTFPFLNRHNQILKLNPYLYLLLHHQMWLCHNIIFHYMRNLLSNQNRIYNFLMDIWILKFNNLELTSLRLNFFLNRKFHLYVYDYILCILNMEILYMHYQYQWSSSVFMVEFPQGDLLCSIQRHYFPITVNVTIFVTS